MAFRTNSYQQLSFADSFEGLTFREQKALEHSWAKVFAEDPISVLQYSVSEGYTPLRKHLTKYTRKCVYWCSHHQRTLWNLR